MSSLIEQAAERLAKIRAAGIEVPVDEGLPGPAAATAAAVAAPVAPASAADVAEPVAMAAQDLPASAVSRLVELDLVKLASDNLLVPNLPRSNLADQFRVIKRPLLANVSGKGAGAVRHGNLIMVTSALPGEGKSFTAINLALSIAAELDHTVMLVDADVARPSVLRKLNLPPAPGLLDLLEGKAEMQDVLLRTNVDKFTLLPSGQPHPKATELLASDAMRQLLDAMASRYPDRIIIFDSPPLLLTTESRVLASQMGQVVMVVHAGKTLQADVQHALATIEVCPIRLMLLNQAQSTMGGGYGYGHRYGYGYGYGYGADAAAPAGAQGQDGAAEPR
ncbi:XrtA-associated tyrosine autokinase [Aquabacterium sp. OR-4]|uniref:XrtA-associated tyrosine autokinase n=1 Tax=Aquabacterium sp. OR-4 TaxID=2978127 RepID=UPI0021B197ED|nr:XrtA-associated tyrosine autokinase [Aquabacterium sp. OR-4]MDT7837675.1 XrtA-associated tyrosine autokinase [Aquabacterium sp. OR-4]